MTSRGRLSPSEAEAWEEMYSNLFVLLGSVHLVFTFGRKKMWLKQCVHSFYQISDKGLSLLFSSLANKKASTKSF